MRQGEPKDRSDLEDQFFPGMMESAASSIAGCDSRGPIDTAELWNYASYEEILYGIDFLSKECDTCFGKGRSQSPIHGKTIEAIRNARQTLPKHEAFLREALGMPEYPRHYLAY